MKKKVGGIISIVVLIPVLLFVAGIVAQFIININAWKAAGSDYRTSPGLPSLELDAIISALFTRKAQSLLRRSSLALPSSASSGSGLAGTVAA